MNVHDRARWVIRYRFTCPESRSSARPCSQEAPMTRIEFAIRLERCWFHACRAAQKFIRTITGDNR